MAEADFPSNSEVSKNLLERIDVSEEFLNFTSLDEICQWFDASQEDNNSNTFPESMQCDATSFLGNQLRIAMRIVYWEAWNPS
ncbi:uncharacterized protein DS421_19g656990 [Arachis hypogaea]|uniref:Uncharacterized protein n=1 Tax=Arachis hypogaea TaxID=3818 RepID=A0A6B9VCI5_ARAHY|nr:uncharacterized protein DS421_19g656990 [Arachis hypogaea]